MLLNCFDGTISFSRSARTNMIRPSTLLYLISSIILLTQAISNWSHFQWKLKCGGYDSCIRMNVENTGYAILSQNIFSLLICKFINFFLILNNLLFILKLQTLQDIPQDYSSFCLRSHDPASLSTHLKKKNSFDDWCCV